MCGCSSGLADLEGCERKHNLELLSLICEHFEIFMFQNVVIRMKGGVWLPQCQAVCIDFSTVYNPGPYKCHQSLSLILAVTWARFSTSVCSPSQIQTILKVNETKCFLLYDYQAQHQRAHSCEVNLGVDESNFTIHTIRS